MNLDKNLLIFGFLSIGALSLFSFLAVSSWTDSRRREREAFYRAETMKKVAESQGGEGAALEFLRQQDVIDQRKRREGLTLGGLVTAGVGIGLMIFLRAEVNGSEYLLGLIPAIVGLVLLIYVFVLAPKV